MKHYYEDKIYIKRIVVQSIISVAFIIRDLENIADLFND